MLQVIDYILKFAALVALLVASFGVSILCYGKTASKHQISELAKSMINASLFLAIAIAFVKLW